MPLTNAEKQKAHRRRMAEKMERMREALEAFALEADAQERVTSFADGDCVIPRTKITIGMLRRARAAITP